MKALLVAGILLVFASFATAQSDEDLIASVDDLKGEVLLNQGEEYVVPVDGARLKEGDQVVTKNDSSVVIRYDDDCDVKVEENTIYTVDEPDDCAAAAAAVVVAGGVTGSTVPFIIAGVGTIALIAILTHSGDGNDGIVVSP